MALQTFVDKGGFKLLAVSRLSSGSYGLVCYLLNCMAAGVDEIVSSFGELSVLLGLPERLVKQAIDELEECNIVTVTGAGEQEPTRSARVSSRPLAMRLNLEVNGWKNLRKTPVPRRRKGNLGDAKNIRPLRPQSPMVSGKKSGLQKVTEDFSQEISAAGAIALGEGLSPKEALLFPTQKRVFSPQQGAFHGNLGGSHGGAVEKIVETFALTKEGKIERGKESEFAELLCENHPIEQIIDIIEAFGKEIPSLGLLAGAWTHFSDRFIKQGKEELSLDAFRKRNMLLERRLRQLAQNELKKAQSAKLTLSEDEQILLRIFCRHDQPRKQLFWALAVKERYPHLAEFFALTADMAVKPVKK